MRLNSLMHASLLRLFRVYTCEEVERFSYDFLNGDLDAKVLKRIRRHLASCPRCLKFMNSYQKTRELGRNLPPPPLDAKFKEEMLKFMLAQRSR